MIRTAETTEWEQFLALATAENWRVPQLENNLFQGPWRRYAQAWSEGNLFRGLVTAVPHQASGWIGNLIVPAELRGQGYGKKLFETALEYLFAKGMTSVWLTASKLGQPIYEKAGFVAVDEIERWVLTPGLSQPHTVTTSDENIQLLRAADRAAWGEERTGLLDALLTRGPVVACDDTVALLQQEPGLQMIGPWYSPPQCPRANRKILQDILALAEPNLELIVDVLKSSPVRQLLAAAGFQCTGYNALMVKGSASGVRLDEMVALASLGSIG